MTATLAGRGRRTLAIAVATIAVWAVITVMVPAVVADPYQMRLLTLGAVWAVNAVALNIALGYAGLVNLGQSAFMAAGAYSVALITTKLGWNPWLSLLAGLVIGGVAGFLVALPAARIGGHYFALITLAAGQIMQVVLNNWSSVTSGANGISGIPRLELGGFVFKDAYDFFYLAMAVLAVVAGFSLFFRRSYLGRSLVAIRDDEPAARVRGVPVRQRKLLAFTLCGAISGLSGGLYAFFIGYIDPSSFTVTQNSILVLSMVLLGGAGSVYGVIVGAFLLTLLPEYLRFLGSSYLVVYGALIIAVILFLRGGIASFPSRFVALARYVSRSGRFRAGALPARLRSDAVAGDGR